MVIVLLVTVIYIDVNNNCAPMPTWVSGLFSIAVFGLSMVGCIAIPIGIIYTFLHTRDICCLPVRAAEGTARDEC